MMVVIKYSEELKMYVMFMDGRPAMKNKLESTLYIKVGKYLKSQNR